MSWGIGHKLLVVVLPGHANWNAINVQNNIFAIRKPKPPYALQPGETVPQAVRRLVGTVGTVGTRQGITTGTVRR